MRHRARLRLFGKAFGLFRRNQPREQSRDDNSYYLLDSGARFVNNAVNRKSRSILECGAEEALTEAGIDEGRYLARYAKR